MANLNDYLSSILTVLRVEEMKTAIINAIQECYSTGIKNGHTDMEISIARGEFETLNDRLNFLEGKGDK